MIIPQDQCRASVSLKNYSGFQKHLTRNLWVADQSQALCDAFLSRNPTLGALCVELLQYGELTYSRNDHKYLPTRYHSPLSKRKAVTDAVDHLDRYGFIHHHKQVPGTRNRGIQSSFKATDEFIDLAGEVLNGWRKPYVEPINAEVIVLRDKHKNDIDYHDSKHIQRRRKRLETYNEAIASCTPYAGVTRIYNEQWNMGGRVYGSWQSLSKQGRQFIDIDGHATVELDYSAIHPSILYSMESLPIPSDMYTIDGVERGKVKLGLLILINATGRKVATYALAHKLQKADNMVIDYDDLIDSVEDHNAPLDNCYLAEAHNIIEAIKERHKPIARYFHSGVGIRLQNTDAEIAERVWGSLLKQGIVALPVHDSFVVQSDHEDTLRQAMSEASDKVIGVALKASRA